MRSRNDVAIIGRTLSALLLQEPPPTEVLVLDNASTDGTREILGSFGVRVIDVPAGRYVPGRVLNRGVREAHGDIVAMVNSDTVPLGGWFLHDLTAPIVAGDADAVYGRQVPRPDATTLVRLDYARAFGDAPPDWQPFFSMAASAFRREVLLDRPFSESVQYSEDLEWAAAARCAGLRLRYVPSAAAEHSHNYTLREYTRRFYEEGRADAYIFGQGGRPVRPLSAAAGYLRDVALDAAACVGERDGRSLLRSPLVRAVQRFGYMAGRLAGPRPM